MVPITSQQSPRKPDIICFGDSLTVGFQSPTPEHPMYQETPYGEFLRRQFATKGQECSIVINGICGELTADMVNRLPKDVLEPLPRYVIILGGTNDLGWNLTPSDIFSNLSQMYTQAQNENIVPVAITVPSLRPFQDSLDSSLSGPQFMNSPEWHMVSPHINRRVELNRNIQDYCRANHMPCIDLFTETAEAESHLLALPFSNDGLHLSTRGYQRLAELLWTQVFSQLESF